MDRSMTELRSVTCHMGSHSVTRHPTQVCVPRLNPSHAGWYSIYLPKRDGRLSWACYLAVQCQDSNSWPIGPESNTLTTEPPSNQVVCWLTAVYRHLKPELFSKACGVSLLPHIRDSFTIRMEKRNSPAELNCIMTVSSWLAAGLALSLYALPVSVRKAFGLALVFLVAALKLLSPVSTEMGDRSQVYHLDV